MIDKPIEELSDTELQLLLEDIHSYVNKMDVLVEIRKRKDENET